MMVKKVKYTKTILLLLIVAISSCTATEEAYESSITREDAKEALGLLYSDSLALSEETFSFSEDELLNLFPPELSAYSNKLFRFSRLMESSSDALKELLDGAAGKAFEALHSFDYKLYHPNESLIDSDLFSSNKASLIGFIRPVIASYIEENKTKFEEEYKALLFECEVLKENYENLHKVGYQESLRDIGPFDYEKAADYAASELYDSLSQSEIRLRNTPLSQQSNPLYSYFWEEL